ncbi:MAG: hypothetical protein AABX02_02075 [archaeon]
MKNEHRMQLNVPAFGLAAGILGLIMGVLMMNGNMMYGGMMGSGFPGTGFWGIGMAIVMGIVGAVFAMLYNWLSERMG